MVVLFFFFFGKEGDGKEMVIRKMIAWDGDGDGQRYRGRRWPIAVLAFFWGKEEANGEKMLMRRMVKRKRMLEGW